MGLIRLYRVIDKRLLYIYYELSKKMQFPAYLRDMWRGLEQDETKHLLYWRYLEDQRYNLNILTSAERKSNIRKLSQVLQKTEDFIFQIRKTSITAEEALDNTVNIEFNALVSPMQKFFYTHDVILDENVFNPKDEYDIHLKRITDNAKIFYPSGSFKRTLIDSFSSIKDEKERMNKESTDDSLTGLKSRKYFFENAQFVLNVAHRERKPVAVVMIDLNKFKRLNDLYGHRAGDKALKAFGSLLRKRLRSSDIATRFGGDEFVLLLYGQDEDDMVKFLIRFSKELGGKKIQTGKKSFIKLEMSVGYALYLPGQKINLDALLSLADKRMYENKFG